MLPDSLPSVAHIKLVTAYLPLQSTCFKNLNTEIIRTRSQHYKVPCKEGLQYRLGRKDSEKERIYNQKKPKFVNLVSLISCYLTTRITKGLTVPTVRTCLWWAKQNHWWRVKTQKAAHLCVIWSFSLDKHKDMFAFSHLCWVASPTDILPAHTLYIQLAALLFPFNFLLIFLSISI